MLFAVLVFATTVQLFVSLSLVDFRPRKFKARVQAISAEDKGAHKWVCALEAHQLYLSPAAFRIEAEVQRQCPLPTFDDFPMLSTTEKMPS